MFLKLRIPIDVKFITTKTVCGKTEGVSKPYRSIFLSLPVFKRSDLGSLSWTMALYSPQ